MSDAAERLARLLNFLAEFEAQKAGPLHLRSLAILLKDEVGATIGGLWGTSLFCWLVIEPVFVPEALRGTGTGTRVMRQAESIALERGCIGIWLHTYSFQARGFYEKLGFEVFG